jgi:hypothetical protein
MKGVLQLIKGVWLTCIDKEGTISSDHDRCCDNYKYAYSAIIHCDISFVSTQCRIVHIMTLCKNGVLYYALLYFLVSVSSPTGMTFRGFLVQARSAADDTSTLGAFTVTDSLNTQLSSCTPPEVKVTLCMDYNQS